MLCDFQLTRNFRSVNPARIEDMYSCTMKKNLEKKCMFIKNSFKHKVKENNSVEFHGINFH